MLFYLEINNFVLIKNFKENFDSGFLTFSGESGAGKSIILNAINMLLGARFENKLFSKNEKNVKLTGEFHLDKNNKAKAFLKEYEFEDEDDENRCIIRRNISSDGKNSCFINNVKCTTQVLKELSSLLISVHSQNKNSDILSSKAQFNILDAYIKTKEDSFVENYLNLSNITSLYNKKSKDLKELLSLQEENNNERLLKTYKIRDFKELDIKDGEFEEINEQVTLLNSRIDVLENCEKTLEVLDGDNEYSFSNVLEKIYKLINGFDDSFIEKENALQLQEAIESNYNDLLSVIKKEKYKYEELNTDEVDFINQRYDSMLRLAKKNLINPTDLYKYYCSLKHEVEEVDYSEQIDSLNAELNSLKIEWIKLSKIISDFRIKHSSSLSLEIEKILHDLDMKNAEFKISVVQDNDSNFEGVKLTKNGLNRIDFLIRTNLGGIQSKIDSIASGGELSRINLAIVTIVSKYLETPTIVFDEIDTGVGGDTAWKMGMYMDMISKKTQVICISHLSQIVAFSDQLFVIKKESNEEETISIIKKINSENDIIKELIRLLVGNTVIQDQTSFKMASELRFNANSLKNKQFGFGS